MVSHPLQDTLGFTKQVGAKPQYLTRVWTLQGISWRGNV
jgi:hypothetical protein